MQTRVVSISDLTNESAGLLKLNIAKVAIWIFAVNAIYALIDLNGWDIANFIFSFIFFIFGQYLFTEQLLRDRMGDAVNNGRSYGALFGVGFLGGIPIFLGYLLLVVPGIYLSARWLQSAAQVVAGGRSATGALGASWDATAQSQPAHFIAAILLALPTVATIAVLLWPMLNGAEFSDGLVESQSTVQIVLQGTLTTIATFATWLVGAASYRLTDAAHADTAIFE
jgi:hypothetical protein